MDDEEAEGRHDAVDAMTPMERSYALHWLAEFEPAVFARMAAAVGRRFTQEGGQS